METAKTRRPELSLVPAQHDTPEPLNQQPTLLRIEEAARLLGYGRSTVYEMVANGELAAIRRGRTTRIPRRALDEWIERQLA